MNLPEQSRGGGLSTSRHATGTQRRRAADENQAKLEKLYGLCRRNRRGAAAVEFALVAIPFFIMILGMIEIGRAVMVQQMLTNASREGARLGVLDGETVADIQNKVKSYLPTLPTSGGLQIQVNPGSTYPSGYGEPVTVKVSIPFSEVSWLPMPNYLGGKTLSASTVMRRETVQ